VNSNHTYLVYFMLANHIKPAYKPRPLRQLV
jgi:hypothetical protein